MKNVMYMLTIAIFAMLNASVIPAQTLNGVRGELVPATPTSADNLKLSMLRGCGTNGFIGSNVDAGGNPYRVSMAQNKITVTLSINMGNNIPISPCLSGSPREEIDLGRLPAGNYTLDLVERAVGSLPQRTTLANYPFTVTDARATQVVPFVRLDYSGHWWDPNDSGWGLFIWHGANDQLLAAWFTYDMSGKPAWVIYQPNIAGKPNPWETFAKTYTAPLWLTSRQPGTTVPPPTSTSLFQIGTASLDFTNFGTADEGKFVYNFNGVEQTRTIKRFKP